MSSAPALDTLDARAASVRRDCEEVAQSSGSVTALEDLHGECLLVTGGTGFVGTWLGEMVAYLNDAHRFNTRLVLLARRANEFRARAPHLAGRSDIEIIEQDARTVRELPAETGWIIHAAGSPDNRLHASDPLQTFHSIVEGTDAVLAAAARLPDLKKVLNVSSGLVYGAQPFEVAAVDERFAGVAPDPNGVKSVYAEAKRAAETLCAAYRTRFRMSIVNARPFAFVGPYQLLDRPWAVNNFVRDGIQNGPIRILGDGDTVRSYMYPSDMAWWLLHLLVHGTGGLSYNVGSPHAITLGELARRIAGMFARPPRIEARVAQQAHHAPPTRFVPDVGFVAKSFGLGITVDLDAALRRTIAWNQLDAVAGPGTDARRTATRSGEVAGT